MAFTTGDIPLLHAARQQARDGFLRNASLEVGDPALAPAIAHAEEVAKILKENIVQGKKVEEESNGATKYSEFPLFITCSYTYVKVAAFSVRASPDGLPFSPS